MILRTDVGFFFIHDRFSLKVTGSVDVLYLDEDFS